MMYSRWECLSIGWGDWPTVGTQRIRSTHVLSWVMNRFPPGLSGLGFWNRNGGPFNAQMYNFPNASEVQKEDSSNVGCSERVLRWERDHLRLVEDYHLFARESSRLVRVWLWGNNMEVNVGLTMTMNAGVKEQVIHHLGLDPSYWSISNRGPRGWPTINIIPWVSFMPIWWSNIPSELELEDV